MRYNYQAKLTAMMEGIIDHELNASKDGATAIRHSFAHRGWRCNLEIRKVRGIHRIRIQVMKSEKENWTLYHIVGRAGVEQMLLGIKLPIDDYRKACQLLQRCIFRHYSEYNAEDIMSNMLDNYWRLVE